MAEGMNVGTIYYEVESDTAKLVNSTESVDDSLDHLQKTMGKTDAVAGKLDARMDKVAAAAKNFGREAEGATSKASGLMKVFGAWLTLNGANELIQMAEVYGEMAERVRMATRDQEEYEMVQQRLLATANGTYRSLAEAQEVYIRTADSLRSMGYSTEQVLDITDSMSYAFVKNATSVDRANSSIDAYTKSINKGKVESDSWESIIAAIPTVINDIATASGKTSAEIREMGASGKITAQMLNEGLRQSLDENKKAADNMATTVKDAFIAMRNSISAYLGEANMATGATGVMSKAIIVLGENIDTVVKLLGTAGAGALAAYIWSSGVAAKASLSAALEARRTALAALEEARARQVATAQVLAHAAANAGLTGSFATLTAAEAANAAALARVTAAQRAVAATGGTLLGLLGGPVGMVALVASVAAGMYLFRDSAKDTKLELLALNESVETLSTGFLKIRSDRFKDQLSELEKTAAQMQRNIEWSQRYQEQNAKYAGDKRFQDRLYQEHEALHGVQKEIEDYGKKIAEIDAELGKRKTAPTDAPPERGDPDVANRLSSMREELALAKLQGEARVRLQAIQKLGEKATEKEKQEAAGLAAQIYRIEQARDALTKTTQEQKQAEEQNLKVIYDLNEALLLAGKSGEELAVAKALMKLNPAATPEEVANVEALARALDKIQQAKDNTTLLGQMDPYAGEQQHFEQQLENLRKLNEEYDKHTNQKLLSDQRYLELKTAAEQEHAAAMAALDEQRFRAQSWGNNFVMDSLDQLRYAGTDVLMSLYDKTMTLKDAAKALGMTILREAVGSVVELGIAQVKAMLIGQASQAAATAASVASAATVAAAWAPAAAATSLAMAGANAPLAQAGIATTYGMASAMSVAGGRQYGGPVSMGKLYRVTEAGQPEIFNSPNGQQFLLPGSRGSVEPMSGSGGAPKVQIVNNGQPMQVAHQSWDGRTMRLVVEQAADLAVNRGAAQLASRSGPMYSGLQTGSVVQRRARPVKGRG